ncbi:MAG: hypothetical protein ACJA09_003965, partial [Alcanivorax sp.]
LLANARTSEEESGDELLGGFATVHLLFLALAMSMLFGDVVRTWIRQWRRSREST